MYIARWSESNIPIAEATFVTLQNTQAGKEWYTGKKRRRIGKKADNHIVEENKQRKV
jgi:hypothetical protein